MTALLVEAGFVSIEVWQETIEHRWRPEDYFEYQVRSASRLSLQSLGATHGEACLDRIRQCLSGADDKVYVYRSEVVVATAIKPNLNSLAADLYSNAGDKPWQLAALSGSQ
jgi:hypothetical protein